MRTAGLFALCVLAAIPGCWGFPKADCHDYMQTCDGSIASTSGIAGSSAGEGGTTGGHSGGAGSTAGTGSMPCNGACTGTKPICDAQSNTCVECSADQDCTTSGKQFCSASKVCISCREDSDCKDPKTSHCDAGTCKPCTASAECKHIPEKGICAGDECVTCTASDESACGGNSCNPATKECTATPVGSKKLCEACVADSECKGGNQADPEARCVPMNYQGRPRTGGFCLRRVTKTCERPFKVVIKAASLSGAEIEEYCGINQASVRCEAVRDLLDSMTCSGGDDAKCGCERDADGNCIGAGEGGLCRKVGPDNNRCTYRCGADDHCPDGFTCSDTSPKYCQ